MVLLQSIDTHWREHLSSLDYLRQGIHLRGYAQKQPKQEYKREAFELFGQLLDSVKNEVTKPADDRAVQSSEQLGQAAEEMEQRAEQHQPTSPTPPRPKPARWKPRWTSDPPPQVLQGCRAARRPQRPLPLRQRQEVQALPRRLA
jgi:preprotein translocase subunit SecA